MEAEETVAVEMEVEKIFNALTAAAPQEGTGEVLWVEAEVADLDSEVVEIEAVDLGEVKTLKVDGPEVLRIMALSIEVASVIASSTTTVQEGTRVAAMEVADTPQIHPRMHQAAMANSQASVAMAIVAEVDTTRVAATDREEAAVVDTVKEEEAVVDITRAAEAVVAAMAMEVEAVAAMIKAVEEEDMAKEVEAATTREVEEVEVATARVAEEATTKAAGVATVVRVITAAPKATVVHKATAKGTASLCHRAPHPLIPLTAREATASRINSRTEEASRGISIQAKGKARTLVKANHKVRASGIMEVAVVAAMTSLVDMEEPNEIL